MKDLMYISSVSHGRWEFNGWVGSLCTSTPSPAKVMDEGDGERWRFVTLESAREDYGVAVPSEAFR